MHLNCNTVYLSLGGHLYLSPGEQILPRGWKESFWILYCMVFVFLTKEATSFVFSASNTGSGVQQILGSVS